MSRVVKSAKFAVPLALAFAAFTAPASADAVADGVAAMPGGVEDVRIAGTWQKDGKSGAYRLVIARTGGDAVTARLFVQWVAYGEAGETAVENSIEIEDFAALDLDIVDVVSESDADGLSVYIETIDPTGGSDQQFELHIFSPEDFRFGPTTN